jgi:hypothetical protein
MGQALGLRESPTIERSRAKLPWSTPPRDLPCGLRSETGDASGSPGAQLTFLLILAVALALVWAVQSIVFMVTYKHSHGSSRCQIEDGACVAGGSSNFVADRQLGRRLHDDQTGRDRGEQERENR